MPGEGWFDDGSGRERWWDGSEWTDRYKDAETAPPGAPQPVRVFSGMKDAGSIALRIYPTLIEFEHKNFVSTVLLTTLMSLGYSKTGLPSVKVGSIEFHCDNPVEVYEYLRGYLAER